MKVVLLAGGLGTRISEESEYRPKPMVEIGGKPILWHIMKEYSYYGFHDFIICAGYKQYVIKEWFADYFLHNSDTTFNFKNGKNEMIVHDHHCEPWEVTVVDTGNNTMTGGRIKRIQNYIGDKSFMMTYGDGVSDINISELVGFHRSHGRTATITAAKPAGRFGAISLEGSSVKSFREKSVMDEAWVNIGFAVFEPEVFDYLGDGGMMLETEPYEKLAEAGEMMAYRHYGFWSPMDTMRDKIVLENLWNSEKAPWKVW